MNLIYFTKDAYKYLKTDLNNNKDKYYSDEPWLTEYFSSKGLDEFYKTSSVTVPNIQLITGGEDSETRNRNDLININLNYSCTSGTASANGCALSDINITDTLQRFPPKKGALLPSLYIV